MKSSNLYDSEPISLTAMEKIQAISWAAKQEGKSYGEFSCVLTEQKRDRVFAEYQAKLREDRRAEQQRVEEFRRRNKTETDNERDWLAEDMLIESNRP